MADVHDIATQYLAQLGFPHPTPAPAPGVMPTPAPGTVTPGSTDTGAWNFNAAPHLTFLGGGGAATGGMNEDQWNAWARALEHVDQYMGGQIPLGRMLQGVIMGPLKDELAAQARAGFRGPALFALHGDPFSHNIRDVLPPPNASGERTYWHERAL